MIVDDIRNAVLYGGIADRMRSAFEYLVVTDFDDMALGRYAIDGDNLFALVQQYETKARDQGVWEAHRRYIDVQYIATGIETIGYAPIDGLKVTQPYADDKDCVLLAGNGDFLTARAGTFFVFFPEDAHMPGLTHTTPGTVRKVVVKVLIGA